MGEKKKTFSRKQLISAAEDMTISMGLVPPAKTDGSDEEILASIKHEAKEIQDIDYFLAETIDLLLSIGIDLPTRRVWTKKEQQAELKRQGGFVQKPHREVPLDFKPVEKPKPKPHRHTTRAEVFADIFGTKPITKKKLVEKMVERYGSSRRQAEIQTEIFLRLLRAMGVAKKVGDKYSMKEIYVKGGK